MQISRSRLRVYQYEFELHVKYCLISMRFPCAFSLCWRLEKNTAVDGRRLSIQDNRVNFDKVLVLRGQVLFSEDSGLFLEKKSLLTLNLNSLNRPNDIKVAGVVTLDLAEFLNQGPSGAPETMRGLERCPDKSSQLCFQLSFAMVRELRSEELHEALSLSRLANELSSIGPHSEVSDNLDIKDLQLDDIASKRINSLTRTKRTPAKLARGSMQPVISEAREEEELRQSNKHKRQLTKYDLAESQELDSGRDADLQKQLDTIKQQNRCLEKQNDQIKAENISLKRRNSQLQFQLQQQQNFISQVAHQHQDLLNSVRSGTVSSDLSPKFTELKQQHETLLNNYYYLEGQCQRLQQEYDHSEQQVWDLTISLKDKQKQISYLQKGIQKQNQTGDSDKLQQYTQQLEEQLEEMERLMTQQLINLRSMLAESANTEQSSFKTIEMLEGECLRMREALGSRNDHIAYFENRLFQLEKQINEINLARTSRSRDRSRSISYIDIQQNRLKRQEQPAEDELVRLSTANELLIEQNLELTHIIDELRRRQEELERLRVSGLSRQGTEATKQDQQAHDFRKKQMNLLQTVPEHRSEDEASMLKEKVEIQEKVREISVELQRMKLSLMKTARTTPQIQQLVTATRPLQQRIFELLSWKKGIMSSTYKQP